MNTLYDMLDHGGSKLNIPGLIVIHAMGEFIDDGKAVRSARDFLDQYKLSAHILCEPNGDFIRCRSDEQIAWHARGHNTGSLGIEILVPGKHDYSTFLKAMKKSNWASDEQMASVAEQVREWMKLYDIRVKNVVRHADLSPDRKVDPGSGFNWVLFQKMIK